MSYSVISKATLYEILKLNFYFLFFLFNVDISKQFEVTYTVVKKCCVVERFTMTILLLSKERQQLVYVGARKQLMSSVGKMFKDRYL
ncbi:CLUMA_CG018579, isoform A [Clunio marinus]|uniref:CLUMA_CG018579, isoform A n=1 Tax=Clunio marinus TaxID=568069 RepID=A0A1J1J265_9DIPT|nr:CLUMA_CG018579, isoform A [Clunio marinus]